MSKLLKVLMFITDIGFLIYWLIIGLKLLPEAYLYKDYDNPLLVSWNWSFLPLDLFISFTGLLSMILYHRRNKMWSSVCMISLSLTFCSGLQAIAFWAIRADIDFYWWAPNLFLMLYPLIYLPRLIQEKNSRTSAARSIEMGGDPRS
ncbi:DUF5360 family protein [Marinicrinis lubricantis]|uniref:DUF5360 family protein n=1 Tax=Marinicrinis lubricantis TaxID=2086470 RepID=A0ABW1IST2_9BACL